MNKISIENRIKRLKLTCDLKDGDKVRHFHNGDEYVEIGGVKWATKNIGAEKKTDFGLYFQYGAKQGYPHPTNLCKFNEEPIEFNDSAQSYWGGNWRMPTKKEFDALFSATTNEWIENYKNSGINGRLFTDKTDTSKKLFFPACGFCVNGFVYGVGIFGYYWSSSLSVCFAWGLDFGESRVVGTHRSCGYCGYSIRGVLAE